MADTLNELSHNASKLLPAVKLTKLPSSLFKIPPSNEPTTLPPPPDHPKLAHPFTIPTDWYNALLHPYVPITIALVYATTVTYLNSVNARRQWKPWAISKTSSFKALVILHNILLAVYSAWTFVGMANALQLSVPNWRDANGLAGIVDSFCKIHGPRGIGSAATFDEQSRAWTMTNRVFHLAADGLGPERSDVGRLWNEGLAFYGWLFYLSKFYEVIDTAIILAKGKKSSFLQTYHHAGAMLCMWAGIRYMSPPIWMFVFVNSFIHALMYTFYFCSALKIHVPKRLKRLLTTMQIAQFVVGANFAFLHLFVAYQIPVSVPYLYNVAPKLASMVASDGSSAASSVVASATADAGTLLKKLALRAAGYEGLAENVGLPNPSASAGVEAAIPQQYLAQAEQRYKDELQWMHCLDTSGQVYAILLNCVYLAPLTWLFVRFFIKAYLTQLERRRSSAAADQARLAGLSIGDASKDVARRVSEAMIEMHAVGDSSDTDSPIVESSESLGTLKKKAAAAAEKTNQAVRQKATQAAQSAKDNMGTVGQQISDIQHAAQEKASSAAQVAKEAASTLQEQTPASTDVKEKAEDISKKVEEKAPSSEDTTSKTQEAASTAKKSSETPKNDPSNAQEPASEVTEEKSFAAAVKEEPEAKPEDEPATTSPVSPNEDGTGADEVSRIKTEETEKKEEAKKEEEQILDESQKVRDEDKDTEAESGADAPKTNGGGQSAIPRPKKKNKKKA